MMARKNDEQWKALNKRLRHTADDTTESSNEERKDDERWEALKQAAFEYVKAYNYWESDDPEVEDPVGQLAHTEVVLKAEAERFRRRSEMKKVGV